MRRDKLLFLAFIATSFLGNLIADDPWKGSEYAKNSDSQKSSADDFMLKTELTGVSSILDVGCGDGKITAAMARALPNGYVVGVDISPSMVQFANKHFPGDKNLSFQVADAAKLDFEAEFDLITSFTVMQWVLEQAQALSCFEKALKPQGRLWVQIPTGLPKAMQEAISKMIASEQWKSYFTSFSAPWRFYEPREYQALLAESGFTPIRFEVVTKHEIFPSREVFQGFLRQWFPYLRPLPENLKDAFLTELLDQYLKIQTVDSQGRVSFIVDRIEVEAKKTAS